MIAAIVGIVCFLCGFALGVQVLRSRYEREIRMLESIQNGFLAAYGANLAADLGKRIAKEKDEKK